MNYKLYLEEIFGSSYEILEEVNIDFDISKTTILIKNLAGLSYRDSVIQPIQLIAHTTDPRGTLEVMQNFARNYTHVSFVQDFDYIAQTYATPYVLESFREMGVNHVSQVILSGTLVISSNIVDIKRVLIDDEEIETTTRPLTYVAYPDNQKRADSNINTTVVRNAALKFTITGVNKLTDFTNKLRFIRQGVLSEDTVFNIKIYHTDNDYLEEYEMRMVSHVVNSENSVLPILTVEFMK